MLCKWPYKEISDGKEMVKIDQKSYIFLNNRPGNLGGGLSFKSGRGAFLKHMCWLTLPARFSRKEISWRLYMYYVHQNFDGCEHDDQEYLKALKNLYQKKIWVWGASTIYVIIG